MRDKLIELLNGLIGCGYELHDRIKVVSNSEIADHLIANGVTFVTDNNVGNMQILYIDRLEKRIKALQKSNRNWRRKCQRLRNPIEATCEGCMWANRKRPQKCSCCRRNQDMKDCYEEEVQKDISL